jgi:hypothetical protein
VTVDGTTIFSQNFRAGGSGFNPGEPIALVRSVQLGGNLGTDPWWTDGAFHMGLLPEFNNIPHSAGTLTIEFTSGLNTPGNDESYAIDNLSISLSGVPEPSAFALAAFGLLGLAFFVRRRKR